MISVPVTASQFDLYLYIKGFSYLNGLPEKVLPVRNPGREIRKKNKNKKNI